MKNLTIIIMLICLVPTLAQAGSGAGAINMTFNTSGRAAGMGDTGVAIPWGTDTNHWANPALLAYRPGIHYISFESQLAAGLADDIFITNEEMTFGAFGVTVLLARGPLQGNFLDMGMQEGVDENGDATGTFNSYMKSESFGLAVDGVELLKNILGERRVPLTKYFSLAGGFTKHDFEDHLAPDGSLQDGSGGSAQGSATSMGYVVSITPLNMSHNRGVFDNGVLGLEIRGSYAASVLNKTDEYITHVDSDQSDPFPRTYISGWGFNSQITLADEMRFSLNSSGFGILGDMINPILSFTSGEQWNDPGYIWTDDHYEYGHDKSGNQEELGRGWEVGIANIFFIRGGHITATYGDVDGETEGGGWKIQAGRFGGFRKDWATVPQAEGLPTVDRESWSVWINPLAIKDELSRR